MSVLMFIFDVFLPTFLKKSVKLVIVLAISIVFQ